MLLLVHLIVFKSLIYASCNFMQIRILENSKSDGSTQLDKLVVLSQRQKSQQSKHINLSGTLERNYQLLECKQCHKRHV